MRKKLNLNLTSTPIIIDSSLRGGFLLSARPPKDADQSRPVS